MKQLILSLTFLCFYFVTGAQNQLCISETKTTHLVCSDRVSYLQVGDNSLVIAEIVPELQNLVRIKAIKPFEAESSLTVVCAGKIYSLILTYGDTDQITYQLESFGSEKAGNQSGNLLSDDVLKKLVDQLLSKQKRYVKGRKVKKDGIQFQLNNIYQKQDVLFFELEISNQTNLVYEVEHFYWWIDDKKQVKATNVQEYQVFPEYQHYRVKSIPAKTTLREVFVLPRLILPDKRILRIEMLEKALGNTGRKLSLEVINKDILKARRR